MAPRPSAVRQRSCERCLRCGLAGVLVCVLVALLPQAQAQAATFFRSASSNQNGAGASSLAINVPAGVVAGDVMIATVDADGGGSIAVPAGWSATGLFNAITEGYRDGSRRRSVGCAHTPALRNPPRAFNRPRSKRGCNPAARDRSRPR